MEKVNIFTRMLKSVTDFNFSNTFIREKTRKSIGLMFFGYFLFALIVASILLIRINPVLDELEATFTNEIATFPDFTYDGSSFSFDDGRTYFEYESEYISFYFDNENRNPVESYAGFNDFILIKDNMLYINGTSPTPLTTGQAQTNSLFTKATLTDAFKVVKPVFTGVIVVFAILGIIGAFVVSLIVWVIVIIINSFTKRDVKTSDLYKVAVHAMVLPGVIAIADWTLPFDIPASQLIYLTVAGFYGYTFLKNYDDEPEVIVEPTSIYEDE